MKFINALFAVLFGIHLFILIFYLAVMINSNKYQRFCNVGADMTERSIMHIWFSLIIFSIIYRGITQYLKSKSQKRLEMNWLMAFGGFAIGAYVTVPFLIFQ